MKVYDPDKVAGMAPRAAVKAARDMSALTGRAFACTMRKPLYNVESGPKKTVSYDTGDKVCVYVVEEDGHPTCHWGPLELFVQGSNGRTDSIVGNQAMLSNSTPFDLEQFRELFDVMDRESIGLAAFQECRNAFDACEFAGNVRRRMRMRRLAFGSLWLTGSAAMAIGMFGGFFSLIWLLILALKTMNRSYIQTSFPLCFAHLGAFVAAFVLGVLLAVWCEGMGATKEGERTRILRALRPWYDCIGEAMRRWFANPEAATPRQCIEAAFEEYAPSPGKPKWIPCLPILDGTV